MWGKGALISGAWLAFGNITAVAQVGWTLEGGTYGCVVEAGNGFNFTANAGLIWANDDGSAVHTSLRLVVDYERGGLSLHSRGKSLSDDPSNDLMPAVVWNYFEGKSVVRFGNANGSGEIDQDLRLVWSAPTTHDIEGVFGLVAQCFPME